MQELTQRVNNIAALQNVAIILLAIKKAMKPLQSGGYHNA